MTTMTNAAAKLCRLQDFQQHCALQAGQARRAAVGPHGRVNVPAAMAAQQWAHHEQGAQKRLADGRAHFAAVAANHPAANEAAFFCP